MSCKDAMIKKVLTLKPEEAIEDALDAMKKQNVRFAPVLDKNKALLGLFSYRGLLKNIMPVSLDVAGGASIPLQGAPGMNKRLQSLYAQPVSVIADRQISAVTADDPVWKAHDLIVKNGGPVVVIDSKTEKFLGLITEESALDVLKK
jgi:CBS domain-containing protein